MIVADHTDTDEAANEARIKRQELRERIARRKLLERRHAELGDEIAAATLAHDERSRSAAEALQPLKVELAEIETAQIKLLASGQPEDVRQSARQREIVATIRDREAELALDAAARDRMVANLTMERREVGMESSRLPNEHALAETAPAELRIQHEVAQMAQTWAERRLAAARERRPSLVAIAERADAESALESAKRRTAAAYQALLDA